MTITALQLHLLLLLAPVAGASVDGVRVEILEGAIPYGSWDFSEAVEVTEAFVEPVFGIARLPRKYGPGGLIADRSNPHVVRATARVRLPAGRHELLLRSLNAARLRVDGRTIASTRFIQGNADGHEPVPDLPASDRPGLRPLPPGHVETIVEVELEGGEHEVVVEAFLGGKKLRPEVGELCLAIASAEDSRFRLLAPRGPDVVLSDAAWIAHARDALRRTREIERRRRRTASAGEDAYWHRRHEIARRHIARTASTAPRPPRVSPETPVFNDVDRFIGARLEAAGVEAAPLADDFAFIRRVSLDTRGIVPSPAEIETFLADHHADRRSRLIERMLESEAWADHWVPYWQDVLAENPGILKPKLNNTGPFRWWIRESFLDGKPIDRFVTELILMRGSRLGGGPAGFAMATQNDVPMAAKAHVLGTAFLGVQLKCARCHDAPHHRYTQEELFGLAAMLERKALEVPKTSSVPRTPEELEEMLITVSLKPGSSVRPTWPFAGLAGEVPPEILRDPSDSRERVAAMITQPANERFARAIANRVWKRFMGWGLVEPVDDWDGEEASHPALLEWLGRELVASGYDVKHIARLILESHAYQRVPRENARDVPPPEERHFRGPARRRMSAEQLVDSLFHAAGKELGSEELNLDVDARRPIDTFLNLGTPRRAWEFASLSNERDRPALSMPVAQSIIDVLKGFGWRETRQDPITDRDEALTVLQPLVLANGVLGQRVATLSDDSAFTALALRVRTPGALVRELCLRVLSREPTPAELDDLAGYLSDGFETRVVAGAEVADLDGSVAPTGGRARHAVSWSNHLSAEASRIKLELERAARRGDPPTTRLRTEWRERAEDVVWALINSPEFLFVP